MQKQNFPDLKNSNNSKGQFRIKFSMKKKLQFGQALYVVGNISSLGKWKICQSLRLNWNQDDFWIGQALIQQDQLSQFQKIQYKFVINSWENPTPQKQLWEKGRQNRAVWSKLISSDIAIHEQWNILCLKMYLVLRCPKQKTEHINLHYSIIGSCPQLGNWKNKLNMDLQQNIDPRIIEKVGENLPSVDLRDFLRSQLSFLVYSTDIKINIETQKFQYYYLRGQTKIQAQRHPGRVYDITKQNFPHRYSLINQPGRIGIFDAQNFDKPTLSKINSQIFVGSYLKNQRDLQSLKSMGINAIYSIQTDQDHQHHGISSLYLQLLCKQYSIDFRGIQIQDNNPGDFIRKSSQAIEEIHGFIQQGKAVYVYCTAGKYRSPQIIALYLSIKNGLKVSDAIKLVQERHPFARPNQSIVSSAVDYIKYSKIHQSNQNGRQRVLT